MQNPGWIIVIGVVIAGIGRFPGSESYPATSESKARTHESTSDHDLHSAEPDSRQHQVARAVFFTVEIAMSHEEFHGSVNFSVSTGLAPWGDPSEYVHTVTGKALDLNEDEVGTITLKLASTTEAENQGERLFDVCDADSAILEAIYATLFDANGETKDELDIEPGWSNLLFVEAVEIKAGFEKTSLRVQLIETGIAMFCPEGLIVAVEDSLELSTEEWRQLGFRRIAKSSFVFLDQLKLNPYDQTSAEFADAASYTCNGCGVEIAIPLDLSQGASQEYVEDCPECGRANLIHVDIDEDGRANVWAEPEQDYE